MMNDPSLLAELKEMGWKDPSKKKKQARRRNSDEGHSHHIYSVLLILIWGIDVGSQMMNVN
jgi:hypothetical protein